MFCVVLGASVLRQAGFGTRLWCGLRPTFALSGTLFQCQELPVLACDYVYLLMSGVGEKSAAEKRPAPAEAAACSGNPEAPAAKRVDVVASKIHGIAPRRKPRIGSAYQAVLPDVQPAASDGAGQ